MGRAYGYPWVDAGGFLCVEAKTKRCPYRNDIPWGCNVDCALFWLIQEMNPAAGEADIFNAELHCVTPSLVIKNIDIETWQKSEKGGG